MKKTEPSKRSLREIPEVDFSTAKRLPRGKYAAKARRSFAIALVEPDLFARFGSSEAINAALRAVVNAVASLKTGLAAGDLLAVLQVVEGQFGRVRGERNAPRVLDLDLLDYQGQVTDTASLALPHPRLHQRRFVLVPLAEIAPDWRHPLSGLTAEQMLSRLAANQLVERLLC